MDSVSRRSFIGAISSLFAFGILQKSKADQKLPYSISEYGFAMLDDKRILSSSFEEFEIIEESIIIPKSQCLRPVKIISLCEKEKENPDYCVVPVSGCDEDDVKSVIEELKSFQKSGKIYIYRIYNEDGKLLNCFGAGAPHLLVNW